MLKTSDPVGGNAKLGGDGFLSWSLESGIDQYSWCTESLKMALGTSSPLVTAVPSTNSSVSVAFMVVCALFKSIVQVYYTNNMLNVGNVEIGMSNGMKFTEMSLVCSIVRSLFENYGKKDLIIAPTYSMVTAYKYLKRGRVGGEAVVINLGCGGVEVGVFDKNDTPMLVAFDQRRGMGLIEWARGSPSAVRDTIVGAVRLSRQMMAKKGAVKEIVFYGEAVSHYPKEWVSSTLHPLCQQVSKIRDFGWLKANEMAHISLIIHSSSIGGS